MTQNTNAAGSERPSKSLILNAFVEMCKSLVPFSVYRSILKISNWDVGSGHQSPGLWRHPEDESHRFNDIDHWVELAQLLESAKFHGIFIADVLGTFIRSHRTSIE